MTILMGYPSPLRWILAVSFRLGRMTGQSTYPGDSRGMIGDRGRTPQAPGLAERRAQHRAAPAASISQIVDLLAQASEPAATPAEPALPCEALTRCEARVLRYLPTHLPTREIAGELYLSANTVKTHQRHLYQKLGARNRMEAVERARALGLFAPSSRRPSAAGS